jgi:hypothetical protein
MPDINSCRFADCIPDQSQFNATFNTVHFLSFFNINRARLLDEAYTAGFCGSFLTTDDGPVGRAARYYMDEAQEMLGFISETAQLQAANADTEYGYCAAVDAFRTWKRDADPVAVNWLFRFLQNSGNCVGASGVELFHGTLGTRAADPSNSEVFRWLMAMWAYAFRGYCGAGWYGSKHASVTQQYGYCFALPSLIGRYYYLGEQDSEDYTTKAWCSGGPPQAVRDFVDGKTGEHKPWRFAPNAISYCNPDLNLYRDVFRNKGQVHHGGNYTSASSKPNLSTLKRIGGHQQTSYGASWHPLLLEFYASRGYRLSPGDFWIANHQTWGPGWSGETADSLWAYGYDNSNRVYTMTEVRGMPQNDVDSLTPLWGPKPEGAWLVSAKTQIEYIGGGWAYMPDMVGWPAPAPPPPPQKPAVIGSVLVAPPDAGELTGKLFVNETSFVPVRDNDKYVFKATE